MSELSISPLNTSLATILSDFSLHHAGQIENAIWDEAMHNGYQAQKDGSIAVSIVCGEVSAYMMDALSIIDFLARSIRCIATQTVAQYLPHYVLLDTTYLAMQQENGMYLLTFRVKLGYIDLFDASN